MTDTSVLQIGRVIEVDGSKTIGELEASTDDLYRTYKSRKYTIGQIGSIVKIESGDNLIFGIITSLRMEEDEQGNKKPATDTSSAKWLEIELFGQGSKIGLSEKFEFERGLSSYPLPGQAILLATVEELEQIYAKPDKPAIKVGHVAQASSLPVHLFTNDLLGKHFAVLGTTGSGKSCSVALLLHGIIEACPNAHIVLLDPHNEYSNALTDKAIVIDPTKLELPHWLLNFEESLELFIGKTEYGATSQSNILKDAIIEAKKAFNQSNNFTVDTPIPYRITDLITGIENSMEKPDTPSKNSSHKKIRAKIQTLREDTRYDFLIRPDDAVKDNLIELLKKFLRVPVEGKPVAIFDLSGVPSDVVEVVVSVLCRIIFDFSLWNPKRNECPLLLVCEEAHRYVPKSKEAAFESTRKALARIAKEGRKYGVGLALITKRPSELSETILSQCNTIIALRLSNDQDQQFVKKALPDSVRSLVDTLPALRSREALVVGEGVAVPVRLVFDELPLEKRPKSENVPFAEAWANDIADPNFVKQVVENWRSQTRT